MPTNVLHNSRKTDLVTV